MITTKIRTGKNRFPCVDYCWSCTCRKWVSQWGYNTRIDGKKKKIPQRSWAYGTYMTYECGVVHITTSLGAGLLEIGDLRLWVSEVSGPQFQYYSGVISSAPDCLRVLFQLLLRPDTPARLDSENIHIGGGWVKPNRWGRKINRTLINRVNQQPLVGL